MGPLELLEIWRRDAIELRAEHGQLLVTAPKGAVTADIAAQIREHKGALLEFLSRAAGAPSVNSGRIERAPRDRPLPSSSGQQRLWYLSQLTPGSSAYNMPLALELAGELDHAALRRALNALVARHEVLRTTLEAAPNGEICQVIAAAVVLEIPLTDLSALPVEQREARCSELLAAWSREPFELSQGPLLRARLLRLRPDAHLLFFMPHHVVYDGLSHELFEHELAALYSEAVGGAPAQLPELTIQYADYAAWQQRFVDGPEVAAHLEFWRRQLEGELPVLELPTRGPRPADQRMQGSTLELTLSAPLVGALAELARSDGSTLFMVLLAGYNALLARFTGQHELVVGTPVANRPRQETRDLIGFFANTLPLRTRLQGDPTFREVLRRTRDTCLASYAHQDAPFDRIVTAIHASRDRSRSPVFQCMFSLDEPALAAQPTGAAPSTLVPGLHIVGHRACGRSAALTDLTLWLRRSPHGVLGTFEYDTDLFEHELIAQLARSYVLLLEDALRAPDTKLSELRLLDDVARSHLVRELNDTAELFPEDRALHQWFEQAAVKVPGRVALRCGDESLTFAQLDARANQLAHHLASIGVRAEQRVGVCVPRSLDVVVALLGVLKAGGAYVPLDPGYPPARLAYMLEDSGALAVLMDSASSEVLPASVAPNARRVFIDADRGAIAEHTTAPVPGSHAPGQLAYQIYTSGSTGQPKGVMVEHRCVANFLTGMRGLFEEGGVWLNDTSISFDISVLELFGALGHGMQVVVRRELGEEREQVPQLIERHEVTHFQCTPSQAAMLVADTAGRAAVGRLHELLVGGEALPAALACELKKHVRGQLVNMYGPTETTVWSTMQVLTTPTEPVSIGRPIVNTRAYVLDAQQRLVPKGVLGELWIGGAGVTRGYHGREELTRERFMPDPFVADGSRMYRTGDVVRYRADGTLEHRGRTDFQVKLRGHRIELGEIESVLRAAPGVHDAVVVLREDTAGDPRLVGYVVLDDKGSLDVSGLRAAVRSQLTEIMVPSHFMSVPRLPLTPNGKVDRRALPAPERTGVLPTTAFEAPRSSTERVIAQTWQQVLSVPRVGRHDNFFDLGGHSLRVVTMVHKLRKEHGIELSLGAVFASPTVAELALRVEQRGDTGESLVVPLREGGDNVPLFCICGIHLYSPLAHALGPGQPVYGIFVPAEQRMFDQRSGTEQRMPDVAELAREYIKALRGQQPHGPYALAGVSFGGMLAFEMACQLTAHGEEVKVLGLFDSILPRGARRDTSSWVTGHLRKLAKQGPKHVFARLGLLPESEAAPVPSTPEEARDRELEALRERIYVQAMEQYERDVRPFPGKALVFRATDQRALIGYVVDSHCGWSQLALGGIDVHHIEGDHLGILSEPAVTSLARRLRTYLDQSSRGPGARKSGPPPAMVAPAE